METVVVPAGEGRAVEVSEGQRIRLITLQGHQAADFFAFRADDVGEWLSPSHSWTTNRSIKPRPGDTFISRFRRPMLDFVEDGAGGVHDFTIAACDAVRYQQLGVEGHHASCAENMVTAMAGLGHEITVVPHPINFFTNTEIDAEGRILSPPNTVPPGGYVELEARADLICVVSSCPYDLGDRDGWQINAPGGPTEIVIELN